MCPEFKGSEQRINPRIAKQMSVNYRIKGVIKSDVSYIKDISKGGMRFTSSNRIPENTVLVLEIIIPYMAPNKTFFEGIVVGMKEISANSIYEVRVKFINLSSVDLHALDLIEQRNKGAK